MGGMLMEFLLGCNYWASNAGADMWRSFDAEAIKKDLDTLAKNGVSCMTGKRTLLISHRGKRVNHVVYF